MNMLGAIRGDIIETKTIDSAKIYINKVGREPQINNT
jgi:hypothetical protein